MAEDARRCWLVERSYDDRGLVTVVYATPDGGHATRRQLSGAALRRTSVTAAEDVNPDKLEPVGDAETRERYRGEVERMRGRHDPDDAV